MFAGLHGQEEWRGGNSTARVSVRSRTVGLSDFCWDRFARNEHTVLLRLIVASRKVPGRRSGVPFHLESCVRRWEAQELPSWWWWRLVRLRSKPARPLMPSAL